MVRRTASAVLIALAIAGGSVSLPIAARADDDRRPESVDATTLRRKLLCGYQGWFRCPGDPSGEGWVHWSRNSRRIAPETLTFEIWPDLSEYAETEKYPAPGFTHPDGSQASLFSSDNADTVRRHFEWMRDHGIDGAWLQHFVVDLPGAPGQRHYASRKRILGHVREAARATGRVWALTYDLSGMSPEKALEVLTRDWKTMVDDGVVDDPRYLHQNGKPVVEVFGFYRNTASNAMTAEVAGKLIDVFKSDGPYSAYLVGAGDWNWRRNPDPAWRAFHQRFDAYMPWNVGNYAADRAGVKRASTRTWADDLAESKRLGIEWIPVIYPGFSWNNLKQRPSGSSTVPRRKGEFLWEQFEALARLGVDSAFVAMFDEVDEGTAIFKASNSPPTQAHFVDYEGLPSDWYLRLVGEGGRMLRKERSITAEIPIKP